MSLTGILARGAAGGFRAMGDISRRSQEDKREAERERIKNKRAENLIRLRNTLLQEGEMDRRQYDEERMTEQRQYEEGREGSGRFLHGRELTRKEFEGLSDQELAQSQTTEQREDALLSRQKDLESFRHGLLMQRDEEKRGAKEPHRLDIKKMEEDAFLSLNAKIEAAGDIMDKEARMITVRTDEKGYPLDRNLVPFIDRLGFEFTSGEMYSEGRGRKKEYLRDIYIGRFLGPKEPSGTDVDTFSPPDEENGTTEFDRVFGLIQSQGKSEARMDSGGTSFVEGQIDDPSRWNVYESDGVLHRIFPDGSTRRLNEEEIRVYRARQGQ